MNSTNEFTLKKGSKVKMENFLGTKNYRNFLEGLKRKVNIFTGIKNIFNPLYFTCIVYEKYILLDPQIMVARHHRVVCTSPIMTVIPL